MILKTMIRYKILVKLDEGGQAWCTRYNDRFHSDGVALALWGSFVHFSKFCHFRMPRALKSHRA